MNNKKIVVIGSINNDLVIEVDKAPVMGETVFGHNFSQIPGGKGSNQAVACARLGADVYFVGAVGDDGAGPVMIKGFTDNNVDVSGIKTVPGIPTGTAVIIVSGGDNYIAVDHGANYFVDKKQVDDAEDLIKEADMVILQLEIPYETVIYAIERCKTFGIPVMLDPAPAPKKEAHESGLLADVDMITPNEFEAFALTGIMPKTTEDAFKAAMRLSEMGVKQVVITLGENGCVYGSGKEFKHLPAVFVKDVIDTTAAGDSFTAALAVSLIEGCSLDEAVAFASKVGSITVSRKGAQPSLPYRSEL